MMMKIRSVMISPEDVQVKIYCLFVTKCMKHISRDNSPIQHWTFIVKGIGSFAAKGSNQRVEASTGHLRIKRLKPLAAVRSSPKKENK